MKAGIGFVLSTALLTHAAPGSSTPQFDADVLPILQKSCIGCHGPKTRMAGLDLHEVSLVLRGSTNGPVVERGKSKDSLLLKRVQEGSMPPGGKNPLTPEEIAVIARWIDTGAPTPASDSAPAAAYVSAVTEKDRQFWSFQTLKKTPIPKVQQSTLVKTPLDSFLLAKLEAKKLSYAKQASRTTLARRAYLDLIGLPPTPAEIDAFTADKSVNAFERLVDRLLASPNFGERWGRHWLDLAGYVDTVGRDVQSNGYKVGEGRWKYRDYVVRAYNSDKSFKSFLGEQIAGDEMFDWRNAKEYTPDQIEKLIATGFLRTAEDPTDNSERDTPLLRYEVIHQTLDILTSSTLGVTVGCARCHNHKFDPIPQRDYYSLMATLTPAYNPVDWTPVLKRTLADVPPAEREAIDKYNAELDKSVAPKKADLGKLYEKTISPMIEPAIAKLAPKDREPARKGALLPEEKRNARQAKLVAELGVDLSPVSLLARMSPEDKTTVQALESDVARLEKQRRSYAKIEALYDCGPPPETFVHRRGDHESKGATVAPGGLEVLSPTGEVLERPTPTSSGRRLALADWLTREGSPAASLVARVYVNRVWGHVFGAGIVATADNFGKMGSLPTHPELLEYLSGEFIRNGWSTKKLIRTMMLSRAYQQSSLAEDFPKNARLADPHEADPDNSLLWRMPLRRLESEVIRDCMLSVSGKLNPAIGGPAVPTITQADGMVIIDEKEIADPSERYRRSMYLVARRRYNLSMLGVFDHPVMSTNAKERGASAVVLQSLMMMNDKEVHTQSGYFADRVLSMANGQSTDDALIKSAFRLALGRLPDEKEAATLLGLLGRERERFQEAKKTEAEAFREALASVCHVLLNANEFLYVE